MPETTFTIDLGDGRSVIADIADRDLLAGFAWVCSGTVDRPYAIAHRGKMHLYMHRLIAGAGPKEVVDHINRDTLDNRASNLRIADPSQNGANRIGDRRRFGTSSSYKGVSWDKSRNKWQAMIHVNGRTRALGRFALEDDAAKAYNAAAIDAWGEFARLNDIRPKGSSPMAGDAP